MTNVDPIRSTLLLLIAFAISWVGVALFRKWSLRRRMLDIPNERSSHTTPIPRGGGLVIAVVGLVGYSIISVTFETPFSLGYFIGALVVAIVSWIDDLYSLAFWQRLLVHIGAAAILVTDLGYWHQLKIPFTASELSLGPIFGSILTIVWIVWLLNSYNFMDGIDGIASIQAIVAALGWAALGFALGLEGLFLFAALFAAVTLGFLFHNWPPAKIFMGDVGSAFLGFTLAAMPLLARAETKVEMPVLPLVGMLFVWFFVFDTVFTLLRRMIHGERFWEAHREHLYQRMIIRGMSHLRVTLLYGAAAAVIATCAVLAFIFTGNYVALNVFFLLVLTGSLIWVGTRNNVDASA